MTRPLDHMEISYIIRAKIEGVSTLTHAFNSAPQTVAALEEAAVSNYNQLLGAVGRGMALNTNEISELIRC